jgi:hypothetical protein
MPFKISVKYKNEYYNCTVIPSIITVANGLPQNFRVVLPNDNVIIMNIIDNKVVCEPPKPKAFMKAIIDKILSAYGID